MNQPLARPALLACLGLAGWLPAQGQSEALQNEIQAKIQRMRKSLRDGVPIVTNVRVNVRLRNTHRIKGVVKQGRFIEKASGLDFVPADTKTPGAGLRIWYYNNTKSYVFLPFAAIEHYRIGERLTDVEIKKIEARIDAERARAAAARQAYLDAKKAEQAEVAEAIEGEIPIAEIVESAEGAAEEAHPLLKEFPPTEGWSEDRLHEIQMRKITIGAYPDAASRRFVEVFKEWQAAHEAAQSASKETPPPTPAPPGGAGEGTGPPPAKIGGR